MVLIDFSQLDNDEIEADSRVHLLSFNLLMNRIELV